jgi:hypothetical protein
MTLSGGGQGSVFDGLAIDLFPYRNSAGHRGGERVRCVHDHDHSPLETRFLSKFFQDLP